MYGMIAKGTDLDDVLHPCRHALERLPVGYVVNQYKTLRALEKARREGVKPLLPRRVPDLTAPTNERERAREREGGREMERAGERDRRRGVEGYIYIYIL